MWADLATDRRGRSGHHRSRAPFKVLFVSARQQTSAAAPAGLSPEDGRLRAEGVLRRAARKTRRLASAVVRTLVLFLVLAGLLVGFVSLRESSHPGQTNAKTGAMPPLDSDGDGITDGVESAGWRTVQGGLFRTNPNSVDTDDDGLTDADEAGAFVPDAQSDLYAGYSDPTLPDTDLDALTDAGEADLGLNPNLNDSDVDGLLDGQEVETVGSAPDNSDTDGDGYDDGYEVANRNDKGLDPLWFDVKIGRRSYITDFAKGAVLGDADREDSLAWLAGNLASGASSSVPIVGSLIGGAADIRDVVGSAIRSDWLGSGYSALGAVPGGDAVAVPGKAAKFVARNPKLARRAATLIVRSKKIPPKFKTLTEKRIWKGSWTALAAANASEKALLALQEGGSNLADLAAARERPGHVEVDGAHAAFFANGREGEAFLSTLYGATTEGADTHVPMAVVACDAGCNGPVRLVDVLVDGVAHEAKVGYLPWSQATESQIKKDAWLMQQGKIKDDHWHFLASSSSNTLGADPRVYDLLDQEGISYTVHLPENA